MALDWNDPDFDASYTWADDRLIAAILDKVSILDILDHCKLEYGNASSGDFAFKMRCPFHWHAEGMERTASFYISREQDSFYCFGCNYSGNTINLAQYLLDKPYDQAIKWLAGLAGLTETNIDDLPNISERVRRKPEETIEYYTSKSSTIIRKLIASMRGKPQYTKCKDWADKQFIDMDILMDLEDSEWEKAKNKYERICEISKKYLV